MDGRKDSDILYNLQLRPSYAQSNYSQSNHGKTSLDIYDASEFVPIEYVDSDNEDMNIFITDLQDVTLYQKII